jgi:hypothetical protein
VGHPEEGVFSFSGLFADGGLELAINGTLEVADVGPEAVGGPPVHELPVGVSTWARAVPAFQVAAFERSDGGDLGRVAGVGHGQQEVAVGPSRRPGPPPPRELRWPPATAGHLFMIGFPSGQVWR